MIMRLGAIASAIITLGACSASNESAAEYDMAAEDVQTLAADEPAAEATSENSEIPVSTPQIAYRYEFGYRLPAAEIAPAQQAHVSLCEQRGPQRCRVINMESSGGEGSYASGQLLMEVKADEARAFGKALASSIEDFSGEPVAASISGEDLSKQIVDTEARLRSRRLLAERLTELLRTRRGSVAELVEAERAVSQVNEEIDQAESWLAEMRGRVAFSKMTVSYQSSAPGSGSFSGPIRDAWNNIASMLGTSVAALITITVAILPWALLIAALVWLRRRFKSPDRTFWGRQKAADADAAPAED